jgi:hypothetical protein
MIKKIFFYVVFVFVASILPYEFFENYLPAIRIDNMLNDHLLALVAIPFATYTSTMAIICLLIAKLDLSNYDIRDYRGKLSQVLIVIWISIFFTIIIAFKMLW